MVVAVECGDVAEEEESVRGTEMNCRSDAVLTCSAWINCEFLLRYQVATEPCNLDLTLSNLWSSHCHFLFLNANCQLRILKNVFMALSLLSFAVPARLFFMADNTVH
jgi:hypothetical protein